MSERTIVIGDIHGCYDELMDLMRKARLAPEDRVISVGDLTVKGLGNRQVLDLFISNERFSAVLGNHDRALVRYWTGEEVSLTAAQKRTLDELEVDAVRYSSYLQSLPLMIDLSTHLVVHAGVRPGALLSGQTVEDLTELRTLGPDRTSREGVPWYQQYNGDRVVLFGHWPAPEPRRGPRAIGLDTGCVYGYRLTAYIIEADEFVSVDARRRYDPPDQAA